MTGGGAGNPYAQAANPYGAAGGYPPAGGPPGAPEGCPPAGGQPGAGGYPPGADGDRGKVGDAFHGAQNQVSNAFHGAQNQWGQLSTGQQAGVGVAGAALVGGAAYAAHKYTQGPPQQAGGGYPPQQGQQDGCASQQQQQPGGGYPNYNASGHSNAAFAGGGAAAGGVAGAGAAFAYQQYQAHQHPGQAVDYQQVAMMGAAGAALGGVGGFAYGKFFGNVANKLDRDYVIIVDKSGSMQLDDTDKDMQRCTRWDNARKAVEILAPKITEFDTDGVTAWLFSNRHQKFDGLRDAQSVSRVFHGHGPDGSTDLAGVLNAAFDDFFRKGKPVTYLIITDGAPDDEDAVRRAVESASNRLGKDSDMSLTFVQVGDDSGATQFLQNLDDKVGMQCKFDIVDTVKDDDLRRIGFEKLIELSIND